MKDTAIDLPALHFELRRLREENNILRVKFPWVGLVDEKGVLDFGKNHVTTEFAQGALWAEARLKELNNGK